MERIYFAKLADNVGWPVDKSEEARAARAVTGAVECRQHELDGGMLVEGEHSDAAA